ncbi:hypothetical protein [Mycobacterium antarcticum]|uniref:hypothetical protein n=1 Tax=unclassified Mycolicibacterium TaxID=2636767 RepID=UPI0024E12C97|nr:MULTISPECIES: hypothetical protein [unclassified Mycolicibacterium]
MTFKDDTEPVALPRIQGGGLGCLDVDGECAAGVGERVAVSRIVVAPPGPVPEIAEGSPSTPAAGRWLQIRA